MNATVLDELPPHRDYMEQQRLFQDGGFRLWRMTRMPSKYVMKHDTYVREDVNGNETQASSELEASTTQYYEHHLQKSEGGELRYCDYDVKRTGKRVYKQCGFISPEQIAVKLHIQALENGVLTPSAWKRFAQKILEQLGLSIYYAR
jgi:hypothetical protein